MNVPSPPETSVPSAADDPTPDPATDVFARIVVTTQSMLGWRTADQRSEDAPAAPRRRTLTAKSAQTRKALNAGKDGHA